MFIKYNKVSPKYIVLVAGVFALLLSGFQNSALGIGGQIVLNVIAQPSSGVAPLDVVYSYNAHNVGILPLASVAVTDTVCPQVLFVGGDNGNNILDMGETWQFQCATQLHETTTSTSSVSAVECFDRDCIQHGDTVMSDNFQTTVTVTTQDKKECHCALIQADLKKLEYGEKDKFLPKSDPKIPKEFGTENPTVVIKKTKKDGKPVQTIEITHVWKKKVYCEGAEKGVCKGEVEVLFGNTFKQGGADITDKIQNPVAGVVKKFEKVHFEDKSPVPFLEEKKGEVETKKECKGKCGEDLPDPEAPDFVEDVNFATKYEVTVPGHDPFDADITIGLQIHCPGGLNDGATLAFGHVVIKDGKFDKAKSAIK
ncbi:MAG: hypothetical protein AAB524_01380 [Patescibacteria group bacterium]